VSSNRPEKEPEEPPIRFTDNRKIFRDAFGGGAQDSPAAGATAPQPPEGADGDAAAAAAGGGSDENAQLLEERTRDLQRLSAEYANYRKRAERERLAAGEIAVGRALAELLPVVDDLDRAKAHGDLTGALKAVADKLDAAFGKLGLVAFGEVGDPFDPVIHEAVLHNESDEVSVPTATTIMRVGFKHGERLLRAAMVGVTDPTHPAPAASTDDQPDVTTAATAESEPAEDAPPPPPAAE